MAKSLVIVESPTKAKTITRFLDGEYKVEASFGHVRDLPSSKMGIDIEHDFEPTYVIPPKAKKKVAELKKKTIKRIAFHEITKTAIAEALENPRELDLHLVDAQQARRVLDRLVGY